MASRVMTAVVMVATVAVMVVSLVGLHKVTVALVLVIAVSALSVPRKVGMMMGMMMDWTPKMMISKFPHHRLLTHNDPQSLLSFHP